MTVFTHWTARHPIVAPAEVNATSAVPAKGRSIRSRLALLATACILPGFLMSTYFIVSDYQKEHTRVTQEAIATARAGAAALDQDLASIESGLRVLATSNALTNQDFAAFYQQAKDALPYQNITNYVLMDEQGRQIVNTILPFGSTLPTSGAPMDLVKRIFDTGNTVVSDVFMGPVTKKPILAMGLPVKNGGKTTFSMNAGIFPDRIGGILKAQHLPPGWIGVILDGTGRIVARTTEVERYIGRSAVPDLVHKTRGQHEGTLETITLEGIPVLVAFSHSNFSGWTVAIGIPKNELTAGLKQSLALLLLVNAVVFATALWFAWRLAMTNVVIPTHRLLKRMQIMSTGEDPGDHLHNFAVEEFSALDQGFVEMTERLRQREKEREAKLAAESANNAKTHFLSRMSHELRTPLNAVLGFAQVIKMDVDDPLSERQLRMVEQIESSGKHLLELISDVLDVSRVEADSMSVIIEDTNVHSVINDCQYMLQEQAKAAGVLLQVIANGDIGHVRGDKTRLKQVLLNLLSNAIKYNHRGGRATLVVHNTGKQTYFCVRDNGIGMTAEQAEHLFEPFNRLGREHSPTQGTGIGLVICQKLVELMGGKLSFKTAENQGSEFSFTLPSSTSAAPLASVEPGRSQAPSKLQSRRVLYVEDNPTNCEIMKAMLQMRPDVELLIETSAHAAMNRLDLEPFDLILLDMHLPDGNGFDVLNWMRRDPTKARIPVVVVSADVTQDSMNKAKRAGVAHYLQKPLDLKRALLVIDSVLEETYQESALLVS